MNWHFLSGEEALEQAGSRPGGLTVSESEERLIQYGPNQLAGKKKKPAWLMLLSQFKDVMILILMAAAVVSGLVGDLKDTVVILIIVVLNAIVGFAQEYRAEKALEALKKMSAPSAIVLRGGAPVHIDAARLVPGDVVLLEAGSLVPADIRLLETHSLKIEEASLTGESAAVEKQTQKLKEEDLPLGDRTNMAFKSTMATYGRGSGVVAATGMQTEIGRIAQMLQEDESLTPLQKRLGDFGRKLSLAVLGICAIIYGTGLLQGEDSLNMLLTAISVAVAAIPEALPAVVTIALALGARRLVRKNALIRKLPAVETLGSVTFICTDKTGTLTQNRMTVTETWTPPSPPAGLNLQPQEALLLCMALNHDVQKDVDGELDGESTEVALAAYAEGHPARPGFSRSQYPRVAELPFDSVRKMMTTVHEYDGRFLVVTKGALESVLAACEDVDEDSLTAEAERMGQQGLRTLAYGCRLLDKLPDKIGFESLEQGLEACGLTGLMDPPRQEAAKAIADCKAAGIVPVMITGDHPDTAEAIARQIGILHTPTDLLLTGAKLKQMKAHSFEESIHRIKVYARVSPEQKLQIVKALQRQGQFVAVTGDGVNDAPALKRANIGIAMGITGTDVSKEAAHMVLLDDNFATIIKAVKEGRRIFDNIRKFIKYTMTSNSGEIWTIFLAPLAGLPIPLLPIHILWINLVTDGLPGLALAGEPPEKGLMKLPPRQPEESIFAHGLGIHILWVGLLMGAVCLGTQAWAIAEGDPKWQTYVFTILCFSQMGHVLAIRSEYSFLFRRGIFTNLPLLGAVLLTFFLQMAILYIPALNEIFSVQPLAWQELGACLLLSSIVFHAVEVEKWVRGWRRK
ncbi:MAG: cation-translocating P-type ATPase [Lewinellaceae bacterium]|nr:cation-translocating P-type ATPase [Phaeodactylibacter sp.]MCB9350491.1 cation-translocating P-type ATPase [Lewinellaceae bacterium]